MRYEINEQKAAEQSKYMSALSDSINGNACSMRFRLFADI